MKNENECSLDHKEYYEGASASIKHEFYIEHQIHCPVCKENLEIIFNKQKG